MWFRTSLLVMVLYSCSLFGAAAQHADEMQYLKEVKHEMEKVWPHNKTMNIVFHGHSVPTGYYNTPNIKTLEAYPHLTLHALKQFFPYAAINSITTSIGGENAEQGSKRFIKDVLCHRPDVLFIDYALNDRGIGLDRAIISWKNMIIETLKHSPTTKIILMTPTPDLTENIEDDAAPLTLHSEQIKKLAAQYNIGLIDSYNLFKTKKLGGESIDKYMSQNNHPNSRGHEEVTNLILEYFLSVEQSNELEQSRISKIANRVAQWQLMNHETQVLKGSQWQNSHAYWAWTNATMYIGLAEWAKVSNDKSYWQFLKTIGDKNLWQTGSSIFFADNICIVQPYVQLYEHYRDSSMIEHSIEVLNKIAATPNNSSLSYYAEGSHSKWCWCDALFMAPTAFARLGKATNNTDYFNYLDQEFWVSYDSLYSQEEHLFFRDTRYLSMQEANGKKVFWGRGNGWVIGGLATIIDNLPEYFASRPRYIELYQQMMKRIASLQDEEGFWHPSMLDYQTYSSPETSASAFFVYGLLWGINRGYLDEKTYEGVAIKGWDALCSVVHEDGKLGYVQAIGADPKKVAYNDTEVYGVGAFLLAASELYNYYDKYWLTPSIVSTDLTNHIK